MKVPVVNIDPSFCIASSIELDGSQCAKDV